MEEVFVRAIYDPKKKVFKLQFGNGHFKVSPEQFSRIVEYYELVLESYSKSKKGGE